ncbi:4143_t:CDS:2, partial [Gigaspora rosea]
IYKNTIIAISLDSLINAFDTYESIHEDKDNYVEIDSSSTAKLSEDSDLESTINSITKYNIASNIYYHLILIEYSTTSEKANIDIAKTQYSNLNPNTNLILYNNNNLIKEEDQIKIDNNLINEDQIKN